MSLQNMEILDSYFDRKIPVGDWISKKNQKNLFWISLLIRFLLQEKTEDIISQHKLKHI